MIENLHPYKDEDDLSGSLNSGYMALLCSAKISQSETSYTCKTLGDMANIIYKEV